jgi:hypothetical protein
MSLSVFIYFRLARNVHNIANLLFIIIISSSSSSSSSSSIQPLG